MATSQTFTTSQLPIVIFVQQQPPTSQQAIYGAPPQPHATSVANFPSRLSKWLGAILICAGAVVVVLGIVGIFVSPAPQLTAQAIWIGLCPMASGSIAIAAGVKKSQCTIIALLAMSIVSASVAVAQIVMSSVSASMDWYRTAASMGIDITIILLLGGCGLLEICTAIIGCRFSQCCAICCREACCCYEQPQVFVAGGSPGYSTSLIPATTISQGQPEQHQTNNQQWNEKRAAPDSADTNSLDNPSPSPPPAYQLPPVSD
jgi:hypothetical protein